MDFTQARPYPEGAATVSGCYSYLDCDVIIIDKYVPSRLDYDCLALAQDELPGGGTVVFFDSSYDGTLALRVPNDPSLTVNITIDGEEYDHVLNGCDENFRYALVSGPFEVGCRVKLEISRAGISDSNTDGISEYSACEPAPAPYEAPVSDLPEPAAVPDEHVTPATVPDKPITSATVPDAPVTCATSAPAHDASLQLKAMRSDNGTISFNDSRSRFLVALDHRADAVTLSLPEGYEFETDGEASGASHTFAVGSTPFTGFEMRIYTPGRVSYRDFDLAVMQAPEGETTGCSVHAYTPIIGAFSGEDCYVIDRTAPTVRTATHSTTACGDVGLDPVTGYKWGSLGRGCYYFELENGGYEVLASFTGEGARVIANPGTASEKVLIRETSDQEQRYGVRITDGQLVLCIVPDSDTSDTSCCTLADSTDIPGVDISTLIIRAIDTIAVESGYIPLHKPSSTSAGLGSIPKKKTAPEHSQVRPEVQTHINNKLAAKKNQETAKTIGIATGAIAVAAGIFSLLGRDKD